MAMKANAVGQQEDAEPASRAQMGHRGPSELVRRIFALEDLVGRPAVAGMVRGRLRDVVVVPVERGMRVARLVIERADTSGLSVVDHGRVEPRTGGAVEIVGETDTGELTGFWSEVFFREVLRKNRVLDLEEGMTRWARSAHLVHEDGRLSVVTVDFDANTDDLGGVLALCKNRCGTLFGRTRAVVSRPVEMVVVPDVMASSDFSGLTPAAIALMIPDLCPARRNAVFAALSACRAAAVLDHLDGRLQSELLDAAGPVCTANIVTTSKPASAISILSTLALPEIERVFAHMDERVARQMRYLLWNRTKEIGHFMSGSQIAWSEELTASEAAADLRSAEKVVPQGGPLAYVVDKDRRLLGALRPSDVVHADSGVRLTDLMKPVPVTLRTKDSIDKALRLFDLHGCFALPIVGRRNVLLGEISRNEVEHVAEFYRKGSKSEGWVR